MKRTLAKVREADVVVEGHGITTVLVELELDDGGVQALGMMGNFDHRFLRAIMDVMSVDRFSQVAGKSCWAIHEDEKYGAPIVGLTPLHKRDGQGFLLKDFYQKKQSA